MRSVVNMYITCIFNDLSMCASTCLFCVNHTWDERVSELQFILNITRTGEFVLCDSDVWYYVHYRKCRYVYGQLYELMPLRLNIWTVCKPCGLKSTHELWHSQQLFFCGWGSDQHAVALSTCHILYWGSCQHEVKSDRDIIKVSIICLKIALNIYNKVTIIFREEVWGVSILSK